MRILISEDWLSTIYADVLLRRFRQIGIDALPFRTSDYLEHAPIKTGWGRMWNRLQRKYRWGPGVARLNDALRQRATDFQPDVVVIYRGDLILPETLEHCRRLGCLVVGINNDDPFSKLHPAYRWRHLMEGLSRYDLYFAYRRHNIEDFQKAGCPHVRILLPYYDRDLHHPLPQSQRDQSPFQCDVSFTGHWEADGRDAYFEEILADPSISLRIQGDGTWKRSPLNKRLLRSMGPIRPAYGDQYNLALNSSRIALVFLSRINRDTYTRRCFEIPATGTFMLSEYTEDLNALFREGVEAEYFRNPEELRDKVRHYLAHPQERDEIARNGRTRVLEGRHEAGDRVHDILRSIAEIRPDLARETDRGGIATRAAG